MKLLRILLLSVLCWISQVSYGQFNSILYLNEISQGIQDSQEYVEFLVTGNPGCYSIPTLDMRGFVIDDNNGDFLAATSPGANISTGALRFSNDAFWQAIPQGTLILVYNESDRNPAIPPDDLSMSDGNARLILPANSILLEGQGVSPSNTSTTAAGPWVAGGGLWSYVSMENDGDSFRANYFPTLPQAFSAISWGTNVGTLQGTPEQHFVGSAAGMVFYSDLHAAGGGWVAAPATTGQTPGAPNSAANLRMILKATSINPPLQISIITSPESCFNTCDALISASVTGGTVPYTFTWSVPGAGSINTLEDLCPGVYSLHVADIYGCHIDTTITIEAAEEIVYTFSQTDETCPDLCDGSVSVTVSGGTGTISVNWSNGSSGTELTDLCPGYYNATIEDANGCPAELLELAINPAPAAPNSSFTTSGPFLESDPPVQLQNTIPGGIYTTADCSGCLTSLGVFDPAIAGVGVFEICYTLSNGNCQTTNCTTITVNPCIPQHTAETINICEGDSVVIFGNWESQQNVFFQTFEGVDCDSIHQVTLQYYPAFDVHKRFDVCEGDSILVFGNWIGSSGVYSEERQTAQGCPFTEFITVIESFCPDEAIIYIPNSFTPNNDGINDVFRLELLGAIVEEGYLFDRWGVIIAQFDTENLSWNGTTGSGEPSPDGVYTYLIRYTPVNGVPDQLTGHVVLLR